MSIQYLLAARHIAFNLTERFQYYTSDLSQFVLGLNLVYLCFRGKPALFVCEETSTVVIDDLE